MAQKVKINGTTYSDVSEVTIPLSDGTGNATYYDTSGDTASAEKILTGTTVHGAGGSITGTMPNIGSQTETISKKDGTVTISKGYHDGTGKVSIDSTEQGKLISENIKAGVTVLGVTGSTTVVDTKDATATASTIVKGSTAYVSGAKVTGSLTLVSVVQDTSTKALTIS